MNERSYALGTQALDTFNRLRDQVVAAASARFSAQHAEYAEFGARGVHACREDIESHLDFLRLVLELGPVEPYAEYLDWFSELLAARSIPVEHLRETILWLAQFFRGQMPGADGETVAASLVAAVSEVGRGAAPAADTSADAWPQVEEFENALLLGDQQQAAQIVERLRQDGHSLIDVEVKLIQASLENIGLRWQRNEVSVDREHLATATAHAVMADAFARTRLPALAGMKVVLACVAGNDHALGIRMIGDAFELAGWEVFFLGADVATSLLLDTVATEQPDLVGLSISLPHQLLNAREAIRLMRDRLGTQCPPVLVGGLAINRFEVLAFRVGADGHARNALLALPSAIDFCTRPADSP